uniref:Uncharacterized protein n=1 Tax=Picea sitchensis TaxID=3332 RepID=D5A8B2_PICSI|nr:unknown [Picea sitchensis]
MIFIFKMDVCEIYVLFVFYRLVFQGSKKMICEVQYYQHIAGFTLHVKLSQAVFLAVIKYHHSCGLFSSQTTEHI